MHNQAANALSRYPTDQSVLALTSCSPAWLERVKDSYVDDAVAQEIIQKLQTSDHN